MGHRMCHRRRHRHSHGGVRDLGLLALRLGTGGVLFAHGTQKLFGWFGGPGLTGAGQWMESMGFRPGRPSALASGLGEAGGGTLVALGIATPVAGAAAAGAMAGAASLHVPAGFFVQERGFEYPAYLGFVASMLTVTGPGSYSLDELLGHRLNRPWMLAVTFTAAAAAASAVISKRLRGQREGGSEESSGAAEDAPSAAAD